MKKHEQSLFSRIFLKPIIKKVNRDGVSAGGINLLQMIIAGIFLSVLLAGLEYCGVIDDIVRMVKR